MIHPRALIRLAVVESLKGLSDWDVYNSRVDDLQDNVKYPNVIVYTLRETAGEADGNSITSELDVEIELRHKRKPNILDPFADRNGIDVELDNYCFEIEEVIYNLAFESITDCLYIKRISSVDTRIDTTQNGETPYMIAVLTFKIEYTRTINYKLDLCDFDKFVLTQVGRVCGEPTKKFKDKNEL